MDTDSRTQKPAADGHIENARALLDRAARDFAPVALASSMSAEDMVLIDLAARDRLAVDVFILDTGRLHAETQALIHRARARYALPFKIYVPDAAELENFLNRHGPDAIYDSQAVRQTCCAIRKVAPLARALAGHRAWITGLRREQSVTRAGLAEEEWDGAHELTKFSPLAAWSSDQVWAYVKANQVPYNPLYDQGYASIGCAPCTRAIEPGADERSGRWWWEQPESRECGLHLVDGQLVRASESDSPTAGLVPEGRS